MVPKRFFLQIIEHWIQKPVKNDRMTAVHCTKFRPLWCLILKLHSRTSDLHRIKASKSNWVEGFGLPNCTNDLKIGVFKQNLIAHDWGKAQVGWVGPNIYPRQILQQRSHTMRSCLDYMLGDSSRVNRESSKYLWLCMKYTIGTLSE